MNEFRSFKWKFISSPSFFIDSPIPSLQSYLPHAASLLNFSSHSFLHSSHTRIVCKYLSIQFTRRAIQEFVANTKNNNFTLSCNPREEQYAQWDRQWEYFSHALPLQRNSNLDSSAGGSGYL